MLASRDTDDVADAVGLAVLVCPVDGSTSMFNIIQNNGVNYTQLKKIIALKRFMFICYSETNSQRIAHIENTLEEIETYQQKIKTDQYAFFYLQGLTILTVFAGVIWFNRNK